MLPGWLPSETLRLTWDPTALPGPDTNSVQLFCLLSICARTVLMPVVSRTQLGPPLGPSAHVHPVAWARCRCPLNRVRKLHQLQTLSDGACRPCPSGAPATLQVSPETTPSPDCWAASSTCWSPTCLMPPMPHTLGVAQPNCRRGLIPMVSLVLHPQQFSFSVWSLEANGRPHF